MLRVLLRYSWENIFSRERPWARDHEDRKPTYAPRLSKQEIITWVIRPGEARLRAKIAELKGRFVKILIGLSTPRLRKVPEVWMMGTGCTQQGAAPEIQQGEESAHSSELHEAF